MRSHHLGTRQLESLFDPSTDVAESIVGETVIRCRPATDQEERRTCAVLRHQVFVVEQGIFQDSDRDDLDEDPGTIHLVCTVDSLVGGTVRIYRLDEPGLWKGDRLAVAPAMRRVRLGKHLVGHAVRTARKLGGEEMIASVQLANVAFFEYLGWLRDGDPAPYHGVPHQTMRIGLSRGNAHPN